MGSSEIFKRATESLLLKDPYVEKVWNLVGDTSLFRKSPEFLTSLRRDLLQESLDFFRRHSAYYSQLFERLGIDPKSADFPDLAKLAVPSDMLRGEGQKRLLIDRVEQGGRYFTSSGTTGKEPVKIYRSQLDLAMMINTNTRLFEHVYGSRLEEGEGIALFLDAPEPRQKFSFVALVQLALECKNIELLYGMDLIHGETSGMQWQKLVPNKERILKFMKSKAEPKLLFTAPAEVYLLAQNFEKMNILKRIICKLVTGMPPIGLGRGGVIVTGGGPKGHALPPYEEIVSLSSKYFLANDASGTEIPSPFMDVFGMTEALTPLIDKYGSVNKMPHPLSHVFLLDPKTYEMMDDEGKEGILGIFNPFVTSWLEAFYPGDLMSSIPSTSYYGREFKHIRRFTVEEGRDLQRACGCTLGETVTKT
ncbi:MAG: hypothetical protein H5T33_03465 [Candidatus Methanosuratus sp.]|nr:hypothetical protein [Candidatus Methanosuratincola sp.]